MDIAFHVNPSQPHQREHALWLENGFKKHGLKLEITSDIDLKADIHIVSGPHYAKERWIGHPRTILLDRAYYHDNKTNYWHSMDYVSLGWMNEKGGRNFEKGSGRKPPERNRSTGTGTIFLADYDGKVESADTVRLHPGKRRYEESLRDALRRHKTAIGYGTTALVTAGLEGLEIICKDERNIMAQPNWLELLPWADWRFSEIESGEAWEHLKLQL